MKHTQCPAEKQGFIRVSGIEIGVDSGKLVDKTLRLPRTTLQSMMSNCPMVTGWKVI